MARLLWELPFSIHQDNRKINRMILSGFFISKYKATHGYYIKHLAVTGKKKTG
jgi:hypothetical protein